MRSHLFIRTIATGMLLANPLEAMALSGFSFEASFTAPDVRWIEQLPPHVERRLRLSVPGDSRVPVEAVLSTQLREAGLHPFVEVRTTPRNLGLLRGSSQPGRVVDFWFGGTRITGFGIKAVQLPGGGQTIVITGALPVLDEAGANAALQQLGDWPRRENALNVALDAMQPGSGREDLPVDEAGNAVASESERVFHATADGLIPAWRFAVLIKGLPWEVVSDEREILAFNPGFFDLSEATVRAYRKNKTDGELKDFAVSITDGTTHLENSMFKTDLAYSGQARATMTNNRFDFATDSQQFREAGIYAHANEHLGYLMDQGYSWDSTKPITVRVGECTDSSCTCTPGRACSAKSNAYYMPSDALYDGPSIRVGEGDGVLLKDLHYDSDVVSHELGHHVVVAAIKSYSRNTEALQLHEGLADTLVMMKTGSPCLGAGICTSGTSSMCYTSQCLRTADNELLYGSSAFLAGADHQKGQLISGLVWDLKKAGVSTSDLTKIVLGAIDLLPDNAKFGDFTAALRTTDKTLFDGAHVALIEQYTIARNLDDATSAAGSETSNDSPARRKSSGGFFGCTVMAAPRETQKEPQKEPQKESQKVFPAQGIPADGPMQLGIYLHDPAGIRDHSGPDRGFDVLLALLLAAPVLVVARILARRGARRRPGHADDSVRPGKGRPAQ